jgi:peptidylprolyl isomerase
VPAIAIAAMLTGACQLKPEKEEGIPAPPDVAAPPGNALRTPSGIASKILTVGLGSIKPTLRSTVRVHYTGWTTDGEMFDSSVLRGEPTTFGVTQVIPGWTEILQHMVVGEKRRIWIPGHLAYDNDPRDTVPKGMLCFEIELLDIQ